MTRPFVAVALVAGLWTAGSTLAASALQEPAKGGRLLEIDAAVVDGKGNPVTDLKQDEVEVWIGGRRIPIESFTFVAPIAGERANRSITLLMDDLTLTPIGIGRAKEIARRFVSRMSAGDQVSLIALSGDVTSSTDDPTVISRRIDRMGIPATAFMRMEDLSAHVLTTLASISRQVSESKTRRRIVVGIGAGWLFDTPIPAQPAARDVGREWTDAVRAMGAANVTLYVIDPGGVGTAPAVGGRSGFARDSGGHAFVNTNDSRGAVDQVLRESTTYYTIAVADPPVFKKADVRELEVRVKRRGVSVRARQLIPGR